MCEHTARSAAEADEHLAVECAEALTLIALTDAATGVGVRSHWVPSWVTDAAHWTPAGVLSSGLVT